MKKQKGASTLLIMLAVIAALIGGGAYWKYKKTEDARIMAEQAAAAEKEKQRQAKEAEQREIAAKKASMLVMLKTSQKWSDAIALADTTSRIALAGPVSTLQSLHRAHRDTQYHPCLDKSAELFALSMNEQINAYLKFMGDASLGKLFAADHLDKARVLRERATNAISDCGLNEPTNP